MPIFIRTMFVLALLVVNLHSSGADALYACQPASGQSRPQDPKPPYPYDEQEVIYQNKKDGV